MTGPGSISDSSTTDERSGTPNGVDPATNNEHKVRLAEKEHRAVVRSKVFVILTLAAAATALGLVTYLLTSSEEENSFRSGVSTAFLFGFLDLTNC
jgi:uncharacterized protein YigA (DUF484 family)